MRRQLQEKWIKTKNKRRKIITYIDGDCMLRKEHEQIKEYIENNSYPSKFAKAYKPGSGIFKNAKIHMYNDIFIKLDIKDFFGHIHHGKLSRQLFVEINKRSSIDKERCDKIVEVCSCGYPGLPLGLVTSPILANLYLKEFDGRLYGCLKEYELNGLIYTRYADDMVISFADYTGEDYSDTIESIIELVKSLLKSFNLCLNEAKTQVTDLRVSNHVRITGISVTKADVYGEEGYRRLSVGKKLKNKIFWTALDYYDNPEHATYEDIVKLKGMISYILSIEKAGISHTYSYNMRRLIWRRGYRNLFSLISALPNNKINSDRYVDGISSSDDKFNPMLWQEESYLRVKGYTVSQQEGLTESQRHQILANVIDSGVMSKNQIIGHLESMISLRKYQNKYENAIRKWEQDIDFVKKY